MLYKQVEKREKEAGGNVQSIRGMEQRGNMPTKDTEKIRNAAVYIDGGAIKGIQEIELPEISAAKEKFIDKLKKLIRTGIFVFMAKHRRKGN